MKYYLGIETSCDDTSIAIMEKDTRKLIWHKSFSQDFIMAYWGGVVPEIAARNHSEKVLHLFETTLKETKIKPEQFEAIAVTALPGLLGPLLTGINLAKTLSLIYQIPVIPVNHLFAHLEAIHLTQEVNYPYLGLLVSGGHSSFFHVKSSQDFEYLGGTIDDAAGEAFDKGGKLLGLDYPAGKEIDEISKNGDRNRFEFPIGLLKQRTPNLSYSGLKTSLRVFIEKNPKLVNNPSDFIDIVASYQEAIVKALKLKLSIIQESYPLPIVVGGGVACNSRLREVLNNNFEQVSFVAPEFCTDNAAMIVNYGSLNPELAISYPESLDIDAQSRYLKKVRV